MKNILTTIVLSLSLASVAQARDKLPCPGPGCDEPPRVVCFNLVCEYEEKADHDWELQAAAPRAKKCQAAARFEKAVTASGDEIRDYSQHPFNPEFEVACDERMIFNNVGHRYTDAAGTRIQAQTGPFPAVLLPPGALRDGHRYVLSTLDLGGKYLRGYCYVYTGPQ